ncbi:MAG TPA: polyketide synthase dehydratase domain-containing protein, partial [Reyranella sp.]|nr:polyketide synthase dehydratase domain-containing protein [Reyranella sp.]
QFLEALGELYLDGASPAWSTLNPGACKTNLPTYPWQRQSFWIESEDDQRIAFQPGRPLQPTRISSPIPQAVFELSLSAERLDLLAEHRVRDQTIVPMTAIVEMVRSAAADLDDALQIAELDIAAPLVLPDSGERAVQLVIDPASGQRRTFFLYSRAAAKGDDVWITHAYGKLAPASGELAPLTLDAWRASCREKQDPGDLHEKIASAGIALGPSYRGLQRLWRGPDRALGFVELSADCRKPASDYLMHPALLDACLQIAFAFTEGGTWLPVTLRDVRCERSGDTALWAAVEKLPDEAGSRCFKIVLFDEDERLVGAIGQLALRQAPQVMATNDRDQDSIDALLYDIRWIEAPLPADGSGRPAVVLEELREPVEQRMKALLDRPTVASYAQALAAIEALAPAYIAQALVQLGWNDLSAGLRTSEELATALAVAPTRRRLFGHLLRMAAKAGLVAGDAERWVVARLAPSDPGAAQTRLAAAHPEAAAELTLLGRCGASLAAVLAGRCDPLDLLFPGRNLADATRLYTESPWSTAMTGTLAASVEQMLRHRSDASRIRVLEVGGGTGATTAALLPLLDPERTDYLFTDISPLFVQKALERFANRPFLRAQSLDIERDLAAQGVADRFDLIVAANVLHATRDLRTSLLHLRDRLAPGGMLALIEGTAPLGWGDLTFGLTDGWWRFADRDLRLDYPLLPRAAWQRLLTESGFDRSIDFDPASHANGRQFQQAVILARKAVEPVSDGAWLIVGQNGAPTRGLEAAFRRKGIENCRSVAPAQLRDALVEQGSALRGLVVACSPKTDGGMLAAVKSSIDLALVSLQAVMARGRSAYPVWFVTTGAAPIEGHGGQVGLADSPIWGFARTVFLERPDIRSAVLDLPPSPQPKDFDLVAAEVLAGIEEQQVAHRGGRRFLARLASVQNGPASAGKVSLPDVPFRLAVAQAGLLQSLRAEPLPRRALAAGEIEIEVRAAG